jgi:molybdopterin converting factor small subunit
MMKAANTLEQETVVVKVITLGKSTEEIRRDSPFNLDSLLKELGVNGGLEIRVNGQTVERTHPLVHGDTVLMVPKIKGGR